jgi:hypothetical protein
LASYAFGAKYLLVGCTISSSVDYVLQVAVGIVSIIISISFSLFSDEEYPPPPDLEEQIPDDSAYK